MVKFLSALICLIFTTTALAAKPRSAFSYRYTPVNQNPYYDIPVTYNKKVRKWVNAFQNNPQMGFKHWLNRSHRYLPKMKALLKSKGLPQDLAYIALIESGLKAHATSTAKAVGYWQFIATTGERYGLKKSWWLDERRDFYKSTEAAASYLADLYGLFKSWYLTAAAYNMGETRLRKLIKKYKTNNFWELSRKKDFPAETRDYIPKLLATVLIAKVPRLYGFRNMEPLQPYDYEYFFAPGGTDLVNLASYMGFTNTHMKKLNPAILKGFIPKSEKGYWIRIPKGHLLNASEYVRTMIKSSKNTVTLND